MGASLGGPPVWEDRETMVSHGATVPFWGMESPDVWMLVGAYSSFSKLLPHASGPLLMRGSRNAIQQHSDQVCCWMDPWWALRLP